MPRVGGLYGERRVATAPIPGVRRTAAETATSTGAGFQNARAAKFETLAGVGSQVASHALGVLSKEQEEARQEADETAVLEARVARGKWINNRLNNPETGALAVHGKDAMPLPETVGEEYRQFAGELATTMKTDRQRRAYAREAANDELNLDGTLQTHVAREIKSYQAGVLKSTIETSTSSAINNANDPRRIGQELQKANDAIDLLGPKLGLSKEQLEVERRQAATAIHTGVIDRLLTDDNTKAASAYFAETKNQIDGAAVTRIEKALEEGTLRATAQKETDKIVAAGGTLTAQREKARAIEDPKLRDEVTQRIEHENSLKERADREAEEERSIRGYEVVDKTHDVASIPPSLWSQYSGSTRSALRSYAEHLAKGVPIETNPAVYYGYLQMAGYDPAGFVKTNLLENRHQLDDGEFKQLANLQLSLRNGDRAASEKELAGFRTKKDIIDNSLTQYGIEIQESKQTPQQKSAIAQLQRMVDQRVEAAQTGGKKVTNEELQGVVDDILSQKTTVKGEGNWWALWQNRPTVTKGLVETTPGDIPASERKLIEDTLRRKGKPISDATVLDVYLEHQIRNAK